MRLNTTHRRIINIGMLYVFLYPATAYADEIVPFRLTGVEGNVAVQRQSDEQIQGETGQPGTRYQLTTTEEEFSFLTHSYVFHPNLLKMDLGAGLLYTQNDLETTAGDREYDDDLYSLTARLRFLEKKPYPVTLYYERTTPSVSATYAERFVMENEKYGMNAALNQPVLPFSMTLEAFRQNQEGRGSTQIINNTTEQIQWRAYRSIGKTGHGQLTYYTTRYHSENGFFDPAGVPTINEQDTQSESVSLDTSFDFGAKRQFSVTNLISYYTQDNLPEREEFRWTPNLTWQHSQDTSSFYRLDYYDARVDGFETLTRSGAMGVRSNLTETIGVQGEVQGESTETSGLSNQVKGVNGTISYNKPLPFGRLSLSAGGGYTETRRDAPAAVIDRVGESVRLDGLQKVALDYPNVTAVTQVIHADPARQHITLVEGVDYEIELPPGGVGYAYIRRLGTINLLSGETVLVDYQYNTGGSVVYDSYNQNYHAQVDLFKHYSIYASYAETDNEVKEGFPTIPVSSTTFTRFGARMDQPFFNDELTLGIEAVREEMEDEISPYVRRRYDSYIEAIIFSDSRLRLSGRRVMQDNLYTAEDIDLRRQAARLTMHPWPRSSLSLEVSNEKDTGSSITRRIKEKAVIGQWRIRKLVLSLDGRSILETQGSYEREHNVFMARINREF